MGGDIVMGWQLDKDRPIYLQIVERIRSRIAAARHS